MLARSVVEMGHNRKPNKFFAIDFRSYFLTIQQLSDRALFNTYLSEIYLADIEKSRQ